MPMLIRINGRTHLFGLLRGLDIASDSILASQKECRRQKCWPRELEDLKTYGARVREK